MKRASGRVRHLVRVELVIAVAHRGALCYPSQRAAALELAELLDLGASTIRRALADETLAAELALAVVRRLPIHLDPVSRGVSREEPRLPDPANPLVGRGSPVPPRGRDPLFSTRPRLLSGPAVLPPPSPGRRPRETRRSRFAGRCVLCLVELDAGRALYLVPYDIGTAVYCTDHAPIGLELAQRSFDVLRGRPIAEELTFARPPLPPLDPPAARG